MILFLSSNHVVSCSQEAFKPFLFNLKKIQDYHPSLATADIIGDETEGVGKKQFTFVTWCDNWTSSDKIKGKKDILFHCDKD